MIVKCLKFGWFLEEFLGFFSQLQKFSLNFMSKKFSSKI